MKKIYINISILIRQYHTHTLSNTNDTESSWAEPKCATKRLCATADQPRKCWMWKLYTTVEPKIVLFGRVWFILFISSIILYDMSDCKIIANTRARLLSHAHTRGMCSSWQTFMNTICILCCYSYGLFFNTY